MKFLLKYGVMDICKEGTPYQTLHMIGGCHINNIVKKNMEQLPRKHKHTKFITKKIEQKIMIPTNA